MHSVEKTSLKISMDHPKEDAVPIPTYVIKANLKCCEACPLLVNKKLLKLPGVKSVVIDREKSLVHVTGTVDPSEIMARINKVKQMAKLYSPKKEPQNVRKEDSKTWCDDHKRDTYKPPREEAVINDAICKDQYCRIHPRNQSGMSENSLFRNQMMLHPPRQHPPNRFHPGYPQPGYGYPQPGYGYPREQHYSGPRINYPGYDYPPEPYHPPHYNTEYPSYNMTRPLLGNPYSGEHTNDSNCRGCTSM